MNCAYVTLLSSVDYLAPVIILDKNLKDLGCQYPLCVMVTEDIFDNVVEYLNKERVSYIKVPVIEYSEATKQATKDERLLSIASKMNVFTLHEFDKVVYLDSDAIFFKNIDELFEYPDGALYDDGRKYGFVGLFVCSPEMHPLDYYLSLLQNSPVTMWESDLLEPLWFPFQTNPDYRIPFSYFVNITNENIDNVNKEVPFFGVHFCYKYKPWNYLSVKDYINDYKRELKHYGVIREEIVDFYITKYVLPLYKKYPKIFN